jgi:hypothetical protein
MAPSTAPNFQGTLLIRARGFECVNIPSSRHTVPQASSPGNSEGKTKRLSPHSKVQIGKTY